MTLFYYIAADRELPAGSFGQRGTMMKLKDYLMQNDPAALDKFPVKGMRESGTLEGKMIEVFETAEDAAGLYVSGPLTQEDSSHLFKKPLVYQVNPEGGSFQMISEVAEPYPGAAVTGRKCVAELFRYLQDNLLPGEQFELYSCFADDTGRFGELPRKELNRQISLSGFQAEPDFEWKNRQFIVVSE
ncbi:MULTISPECIES: hypothetical protein [Paenibacillus]|uniref:hypothetical protein n=1 Tax=Paenibacillus TaxID=44249 RepID=UPI0004F5C18A|nr:MULTISPECIES: hypothetical protein [unclassified Paenibacillus]AIQ30664.1 hypothetical protein P40081_22715 [Paenibacillus sp. FSL P4-0081]OMF30237.1 hypothetical protein BK132_08730 [Paenibacillus sp. FSL H8-0259]